MLAKVLIAEDGPGPFAEVYRKLTSLGVDCAYTDNPAELIAQMSSLEAKDNVDLLLMSRAVIPQLITATVSPKGYPLWYSGFLLELPAFGDPQDPPGLRRSVLHRFAPGDSVEDIAGLIVGAIPRVAILRKSRKAAKYVKSVGDAIRSVAERRGAKRSKTVAAAGLELHDEFVAFDDVSLLLQACGTTDASCLYQRCDRFSKMARALQETVDVLRATKNHFKSKELGELRKKLELTLVECLLPGRGPEVASRV